MNQPMRISLACSVMLMLAAGGMIFLQFPPDRFSFYPRCQLHQFTGLYCPGCGTTRCLHALLQGQFADAARKNIVAFAVLPIVGAYALLWCWSWALGKPVRWHLHIKAWLGTSLAVILIVFGVLRNLPWHPFILLAPH